MTKRIILFLFILIVPFISASAADKKPKHTFKFSETEFLLDGEPFQIISGEMHPARIPLEYWRHRIQMAKAMGCNTISIYVFWNYYEEEEGIFDFSTGNRNIGEFIRLVQEEDMWLIVRPGPYVCAEWDLGGIPSYLLKYPDIKLRTLDPRFMEAAERYMARFAEEIKPYLITRGGPILMIQIENEYGSFSNDHNYMSRLRDIWVENGIDIPTFTGDGPTIKMLEGGTLPGSAVGLDSGSSQADFDLAAKMNPGVPVFSSETYPGWLTHWGEEWARTDTTELINEVRFLMDNRKSFNFYVIHGGTNFGFTAGANSGRQGYEPDITSYDYDAPVNEQGRPTPKYMALRALIGSYLPKKEKLPTIPDPVPAIQVELIFPVRFTSVWDNLPEPVASEKPLSIEEFGQDHGFILYRKELKDGKDGLLTVKGIHDYATVFLNGEYLGVLDRREAIDTITIPVRNAENHILEILAEGMGRINYGPYIFDRKGITGNVALDGEELLDWQVYNLPMDRKFIYDLRSSGKTVNKPGVFFKGDFSLAYTGDTFFDVSNFRKGVVWVNGHNLGRYWDIGPQKRLYCPASYVRPGMNEILIFDLHMTWPKPVGGMTTQN
ncbi:MAG: beta-galactosidase [Bacteroidetes bacterium RBG_13_43_22]|nr:MAG: beta-galactosidase [Bacteroidetes bacterium RBG_13_43_22]